MYKALIIAFAFLFLGTSCVKKPLVPVSDVTISVPTDFSPERYLFVKELNVKGKLAFLYQDQDGYMHYYNGKEDRIINREVMDRYKKMGGVPMNMSYGYDGEHIYVSQPVRWGPKKLIFMKLEPEGAVVYTKELSSLEQVIRPASIAFDGKGSMLLTWIDETAPYVKAAYMLVKEDSFPEKEEIISYDDGPVLSVQPAFTDKGLAVVYVRTDSNENGEIRVRFLSDGSEKMLYSGNVSDFDLSEERGTFLIRPYEQSLVIKLITFNASFDMLKEIAVSNPEEIGLGFSPFTNGRLINGEPFILGGGSPPTPVKIGDYSLRQRPNLYYSYAGRDFERISGGRPFMFTSTLPSFDNSGSYTVVAYVDKRLASPSVMAAVFDSSGNIIKRDIVIEKPWLDTGSPMVVHLGEDLFRIFYPVQDKEQKVWVYRAKDIKADSIESLYEMPSSKERLELLTKSVNKYVECRKKDDFGCVYDMLDPTYRSGISKGEHEAMMKRTNATIIDYGFDDCKLLDDSVLAACDGFIKATLPGEIMHIPVKKEQRTVDQKIKGDLWVFIDGKWYYIVNLPMLGYALQW